MKSLVFLAFFTFSVLTLGEVVQVEGNDAEKIFTALQGKNVIVEMDVDTDGTNITYKTVGDLKCSRFYHSKDDVKTYCSLEQAYLAISQVSNVTCSHQAVKIRA